MVLALRCCRIPSRLEASLATPCDHAMSHCSDCNRSRVRRVAVENGRGFCTPTLELLGKDSCTKIIELRYGWHARCRERLSGSEAGPVIGISPSILRLLSAALSLRGDKGNVFVSFHARACCFVMLIITYLLQLVTPRKRGWNGPGIVRLKRLRQREPR